MNESTHRGSILIIDDDPDIRETLTDVLEDVGYQVVCAANGQEALDHLKQAAKRPALMVLDVMMPVMNGIQFRIAQKLDVGWSKIAVILMSAHSRDDVASKMSEMGLDGVRLDGMFYLQKPIELTTFLEAIHAMWN